MRWTGGDSTLNDDVSGMINSYDGDSAGKLHSSILALCASSEDFGKKKNNVKMWLFVHICLHHWHPKPTRGDARSIFVAIRLVSK